MSTILETLATTVLSGALTAGGAYIAIIWKLNRRVAVLETKVTQLDKTIDELKDSDDRLTAGQSALKTSVQTELSDLKEAIHTQISNLFRELFTKLEVSSSKLTEDLADAKMTFSERSGQCVSKQSFDQYTQEEEHRWQEFYKAVGKLEAVLDRIFHGSTFPPPKLTPPASPTGSAP